MDERLLDPLTDQLFSAILSLEEMDECYSFFEDICTVGELKSLSQRLEVARMLEAGCKYEEIVSSTGVSSATISRVKKCLHYGANGYRLILDRIKERGRGGENESI